MATSFVLGYHGCDQSVAEKAVVGGADILSSHENYDWLGPGAYFWESDPQRAKEWADWKVSRGDYSKAAVVGAVIDLGNCLDLVARENVEMLRDAHSEFVKLQKAAGLPIPKNKSPKGARRIDRIFRFLDCAVICHLHDEIDRLATADPEIRPFDTVRGMFVEGGRAFPGSGFHLKNHVQIAVRTPECIKGVFYPQHNP